MISFTGKNDIQAQILDKPMKGITLSRYDANIDIDEDIKFVIIRAGQSDKIDPYFQLHYYNARNKGMLVGAYWYSTATTATEMYVEAKMCAAFLSDYHLDLPIYFEQSDKCVTELNCTTRTVLVTSFCSQMIAAGKFPGYKTMPDMLGNIDIKAISNMFTTWIDGEDGDIYGGKVCYLSRDFMSEIKHIESELKRPRIKFSKIPTMVKANNKIAIPKNGHCEYFKEWFTDNPVGFLTKDVVCKILYIEVDNEYTNGFRWFQIELDGKSYWVADPEDGRISIEYVENKNGIYNAGRRVWLSGQLYQNDSTKTGVQRCGEYYIYDGNVINGRYAITSTQARVNKKPASTNISGWATENSIIILSD